MAVALSFDRNREDAMKSFGVHRKINVGTTKTSGRDGGPGVLIQVDIGDGVRGTSVTPAEACDIAAEIIEVANKIDAENKIDITPTSARIKGTNGLDVVVEADYDFWSQVRVALSGSGRCSALSNENARQLGETLIQMADAVKLKTLEEKLRDAFKMERRRGLYSDSIQATVMRVVREHEQETNR